MRLVSFIFIIFFSLVSEVQSHDFYTSWKTKEGTSCCNSMATHAHGDCAPLPESRLRLRGETVEVQIGSEWVQVEKEKIRPYSPPDMSHHLCNRG